jgi:glutathione synthase
MRHLFIVDPLASLKPAGDTSIALMRQAQALGDEVWACEQRDLAAGPGAGLSARAVSLDLTTSSLSSSSSSSSSLSWASVGTTRELAVDDVQVVWMRKDPPVDELFLTTLRLLERHNPKKTVVLNDPRALRVVHEKLWALEFPDLVPPQVVSARKDVLLDFVAAHGTAVVKPLAFMGGMGVMVFEKGDRNLKSAIDLLTAEGTQPAMAQAYLPGIRVGDKRVICVDGEPIAALLRVPKADDVRANLHAGGTATTTTIDDDDRRICERLRPELVRLGIFFAGLDVIGGRLTEVNVTSPTGVATIDVIEQRSPEDSVARHIMTRARARFDRLASA